MSTISRRSTDDLERAERSRARPFEGGRLGVYAAMGALTGWVPLPWVPASLARRVRGALVHDVAVRHGCSLSKEARDLLANPTPPTTARARSLWRQGLEFVGVRVIGRYVPLGPLAMLGPVRIGAMTWALGHLFDRYLERARVDPAVRIDAAEAQRVREAIDRAVVHAFTATARGETVPTPPEELRDTTTQVVDGVLGAAAAIPGFVVRRLEAAFDELMPEASAR